MAAADHKVEGYLRKNRAGMPFAKMSNRRYFSTEGFTVFYYNDMTKAKVKGHFDLRNVVGLMPSQDTGVGEPGCGGGALRSPRRARRATK